MSDSDDLYCMAPFPEPDGSMCKRIIHVVHPDDNSTWHTNGRWAWCLKAGGYVKQSIPGWALLMTEHPTVTPIDDPVSHPAHYTSHPSGIECIMIARHHNFPIGNAIKYLWRAGLKDGESNIKDLKKAVWYINDEIARLEKEAEE